MVSSAMSLPFLAALLLLLKAFSAGDSRISLHNPLQGFIVLLSHRLFSFSLVSNKNITYSILSVHLPLELTTC